MSTYDMLDHGPAPNSDEDAVMRDLLRMIMDQIWWVLAIAGCVILAAVIYTKLATPIYSADALLQVDTQTGNNGSQSQNTPSLVPSVAPMRTEAEIEIIKSRAVVEPVVEQFKLNFSTAAKTMPVLGKISSWFAHPGRPLGAAFGMDSYAWGGEQFEVGSITVPKSLEGARLTLHVLDYGRYELTDSFGQQILTGVAGQEASGNDVTLFVKTLVARPGTEFYVTRFNQLDAVAALSSGLQVAEKGRDTGVVQLSYMGTDPHAITAITNAVAASYLAQRTERAQEEASHMLSFLNSELPRLRAEVKKTETALSEYQSKAGSFQPTQEAGVYLAGGLDYEKQIATLRIQRAQLLQRFTEESPEVQQVDAQLAAMSREKARFEDHFSTLPSSERNALSLQRDAKVAEEIYVALLNKTQELSISRAGTIGNVHIIDAALLPSQPVRPKSALIISAGTLLGIIGGILFAFCRHTFFTGVADPEFVERRFQLPIFGSIAFSPEQARSDRQLSAMRAAALHGPRSTPTEVSAGSSGVMRALRPGSAAARQGQVPVGTQTVIASGKTPMRPLLVKTHPYDTTVEGLRGLRATLQFGLVDAPNRIVAITSPAPSDGKSFLCANLAALIAESGKRVLLIDADLRRGRLAQYLGRSPNGGLTELLTGQVDLEVAARATGVDGLHFIAAGAYPPNPSEILTSSRFGEILARFEQEFDLVIVDTPPLLAVADAAVIAHIAGSTVLVMRSGAHTEGHVADALKKLRRARARVVGGVMNAVPLKSHNKNGTYDYAYAYTYSAGDPLDTHGSR
ncbi:MULTISPECIES: polysaccharide biosynthesis tyrosine autokinase [Paraburkholderia]|uniref:Polysaccharide biosynthesis tyrosine autokinase n=1 Tax=Paraburkholderia madseniana TaxID=2599607 RepID=A0A6N6WCI0_9BURK|nr:MULTISPECIES: polysaccharide biosynthesis tyrosine autokinase [Paraburkholderia]KAE8758357.1 polysaccharide biosynthesis tyrosine autokinase [Paraburkholderia madseniana]MCX4172171.1 polysaccharide biosynthesis tyrosine autokinase [Paraburkholderia madseniana]MDQ6460180.1 polysaccharide biosynthesis tyrosine autokinase [Paraburkholderia madseniana]